MQFELRMACKADAEDIVALVNRAYHPPLEEGCWTHESNLIFGRRTTLEQVLSLFRRHSAILLLRREAKTVACVHVEGSQQGTAYIGMLATEPTLQGRGLGKRMLRHAEGYAAGEWKASTFKMLILSARPELLAFYKRRGYRETGQTEEYPFGDIGRPLLPGLHFLALTKTMPTPPAPSC